MKAKMDRLCYIRFAHESFFRNTWTQDNYISTKGKFEMTFWPYSFPEVGVVKWSVKKVKKSYYFLFPFLKLRQLWVRFLKPTIYEIYD